MPARAFAAIDPATGRTLREYPAHGAAAVEAALEGARAAATTWGRTPVRRRAELLLAAAERLEAEKRALAETMTREMGKPIRAAVAEVEKCALACRFYAERAPGWLADEPVDAGAVSSFVRYEPLGCVLAVMPWNFPLWQVFRFAAPALAAGNVALLKHASNVPGSALAIERLLADAGFPAGVFQTLLVDRDSVGGLIDDPRIAAVTLTGSVEAGASVAARAGAAIKKCVLELGGSDAFVVLPSADLEAAAATAVRARTINNGQSCIAAKRFVVHRAVHDAWLERFVAGMAALRVGDPMDEATDVGPLATRAIRDGLVAQVERSAAAGAKVLLGGRVPDGPGDFYPPTVLVDAPPDSPAAREELFGPVATVFRADDLDHAIALANHPVFGLGAAAWTRDGAEIDRLTRDLEAGTVTINGMVQSDPRLPFGGIKRSGYGRELSIHGLREFVNVKAVRIDGRID
jgi:succinate-semialdehyde dehydrogenase/glutarate-semialdehyde dehydrogenase